MKNLMHYLFTLVIFFNLLSVNAQNTPAGVGDSYNLNLWLSAEDISGISDGDPLNSNWQDRSGNAYHASQSTGSYQPSYHESVINGFPVVRFDGQNDLLDNAHAYDARTVFSVFQMSSANQVGNELAQVWGNYADGVHVAPDPRSGGNERGFSFDGQTSSNTQAKYAMSGNTYTGFQTNNNAQQWTYDQFEIVATEFQNTETINRQVIGSLYPQFNIGDHQLGGDIAEIIVFEQSLGATQKILVENYLAAKYALAISNDLYAFETTHKYDLAGIGRATSGNEHTEALSAGVLGLKESDALAVNDYALLAHDNGSLATWTTNNTPTNYSVERLGREWKVDLSGSAGKTIVKLDTTDLPAKNNSNAIWAVMVDADGDFSGNAEVYLLSEQSGYFESDAFQLNDGDHIAIAAVEPELNFALNNFSAIESEDSIIAIVALDVPLSQDVGFNIQTSDSTASNASDYTSLNKSFTISAGDTLIQIGIQMSNDTIVEADEFIKLKLIPDNATLFTEQNALATINDDDNPRKVSFQLASLSGAENFSPINVNVVLNTVDSTNSTTVKYRVKSSTAQSGSDYSLASGTLTFPALSATQSFSLSITDDSLYEPAENIIVELYQPTNSNLSDTNPVEFTYTIMDNDPEPELSFVSTSLSKQEANVTVKVPVGLSSASGSAVSYTYRLKSSSATGGDDFSFSDGSGSILSGSTNDTIMLQLLEDAITEVDENVVLSIEVQSGAITGTDSLFTLTIRDNDVFGFKGPGGVGDSALNVLWLDAGNISGISSGNAINTQWTDNSGNENHATQGNSNYQPKYIENAVNNLPVVRFDGANDFFDNSYNYDAASGIIVLRVSSSDQQSGDLAQLFGNYDEGQFSVDPRGGGNVRGMSFDGGTSERGRYRINGGDYTAYGNDINNEQWSYDQYFILTGNFENILSLSRMVIGSLSPSFSVGDHQFGGDIAEMIVFQNHLNAAQNNIIENYLAAKYDISISNDLYSYESTHAHGLVGVGQETSDDIHIQSESAGMLKLHNPQNLADGTYIFAGHDNGSIASWSSTATPNLSTRILERTWKIDATDTTATLDFSINTSDLPTLPSGFAAWALLVDENGDFNSGSMYHVLNRVGITSNYTASSVKVKAGDVVAIAAVKNISAKDGAFNNATTWMSGVPGSSDTAIIAANHSIDLSGDISTAHIHLSRHGRLDLGSNTYSLTEGSMEINGTMDMGTGTVSYSASGDQSIANVTYNHLKIEGSGSKTLSANTVVEGNLVLDAGTLDANSSQNYTLQVAGNWVNNGGTFEPRSAEVDFNGAATQSITSDAISFYTVRVSGSGPYELNDDLSLGSELILENGVITTGAHKVVMEDTNDAALSTYSNASFVNGNLQRAVGVGHNEYNFPVGNGISTTDYHLAEVAPNALLGLNNITVHFTALVRHDDQDINASDAFITYESISPDGMWVISPDQQPTAGTYNVKLYLDNMSGLTDNEFAVIKRAEGAPNAAAWSAVGNINAMNGLGRKLSDGYALRMGLTSFSEFGVGSGSDSGDPLPVELLYFNAKKDGQKALLNWATVTEINADRFEIQRSVDAESFETIGEVAAQGNSVEEVQYRFVDQNPADGDNYYRLKQIDNNGLSELFEARYLNFDAQDSKATIAVYPNPSSGSQLNIDVVKSQGELKELDIKIYNMQGRLVYNYSGSANLKNQLTINRDLEAGIYLMNVRLDENQQQIKWIIE